MVCSGKYLAYVQHHHRALAVTRYRYFRRQQQRESKGIVAFDTR